MSSRVMVIIKPYCESNKKLFNRKIEVSAGNKEIGAKMR